MKRHLKPAFAVPLAIAAIALAACQSTEGPGMQQLTASRAALPVMESVMVAANRCWFASGDQAFAPYMLAPELNSFSGRPRILLVPRGAPEERPLAVVNAEGEPARIEIFGPLMDGALGSRIASDVGRWASGNESCSATA